MRHPGKSVIRLVSRVLAGRQGTPTEPPALIVPTAFYDALHALHDQLVELDNQGALGTCEDAPGVGDGCSVCNLTTALQEAYFTWRPEEPR